MSTPIQDTISKCYLQYKCRRCGTNHTEGICGAEIAMETLDNHRRLHLTVMHLCEDEGMGISDLIGISPPVPLDQPLG